MRALSAIQLGPENPYVGFGAGARDLYTPVIPALEMPADYQEGAKLPLGPEDMDMIRALEADPNIIKSVGGNIINVMTYLSSHGLPMRFVGALGVDDGASTAIRSHLNRFGIQDATVTKEGYQPSYSRIRRVEGKSREISGAPRTPILEAVERAEWAAHLRTAGAVGASSLNSLKLNSWIMEDTPEGTSIFYNPGGGEFRAYGPQLINIMHRRVRSGKGPVTGLALNDTEMMEMHGLFIADMNEKYLRELAENLTREHAGGVALRVLCTMDKAGFIIAENGDSQVYAAKVVEKPEDTTAAGDESNAANQMAMMEGLDPDCSAEVIREAGHLCVQHIGNTHRKPYALAA